MASTRDAIQNAAKIPEKMVTGTYVPQKKKSSSIWGGKNSFFNKPLGKNSDASRIATAVLKPARATVDSVDSLRRGDIDKAKNYALGAITSANPFSMASNASPSAKKFFKSTGFTDQLVQMTDSSNKLASGKNLNWNEIRGYTGGLLENAAYAGALAFGGQAFASKAGPVNYSTPGYLGANTTYTSGLTGVASGSAAEVTKDSFLVGLGKATATTLATGFTANLLNGGQGPRAGVGPDKVGYESSQPYFGDRPAGTNFGTGPQIDPKLILLAGAGLLGFLIIQKKFI